MCGEETIKLKMNINEVLDYLKKCSSSEKVKTYLNYISNYVKETEDIKGRAYHIYKEDINRTGILFLGEIEYFKRWLRRREYEK